jgi:hypothetical protein
MMDGNDWSTYGTTGSGTGQFRVPNGLDYHKKTGYIYLTDYMNHRIVKTKMGGMGWTTYGTFGTGTGQFYYPSGISYNENTNFVLMTDSFNNRIVKTKINGSGWTTFGTQGTGTGQFNNPYGISYDSSTEFFYVVDYGNHRIVKTKINGSGWTTYGSQGNGKGQFYYPGHIVYDRNTEYLYITDRLNHRIIKTMMNGSGWTTYGSYGSGKGQFNYPWGIHFDSETEYIYIGDTMNNRIVKTMINGSGWTTLGSTGSGIKQFNYPMGIDISEYGYCPEGFLVSKKINCGSPANLQTLSWVADTPKNTSIKFQIRTAPNQTALLTKPFKGPNGSANTFYTKSGAAIWGGHDGDKWVQYKVYLTTGNVSQTPVLKDVTIVYNILPKQPDLISPIDNSISNNNSTTFTWQMNDTDSVSQIAFQWQADNDKTFKTIVYDSNIVASLQSAYTLTTPLRDGIWYWRIRTKDNDDGWGPYSDPWKIQIDTKPPESKINLPKHNHFYKKMDKIRGTVSDPEVSTGIDRLELLILRVKDSKYWDGSTWSSDINWLLANGTSKWSYNSSAVAWTTKEQYRIYSRGIDNTTNFETEGEGIQFTIDVDDPRSLIMTPQNNSYLQRVISISGTANDFGGAGVKKVEIAIKQNTNDMYWDGSLWVSSETWLLTTGTTDWNYDSLYMRWASNTQYSIFARSIDMINNIESPTIKCIFNIDMDGPISNIIHPLDGSYQNQLTLISGNATDIGGSGIENIEVSIRQNTDGLYWDDKSWQEEIFWLPASGFENWTLDTNNIYWINDYYYTIRSTAYDKAGNYLISWPETIFMFDNKPPEQSFVINNNATFVNNLIVNLTLKSDDSGSGVTLMAFSNNNIDWMPWESVNTSKEIHIPNGDGIKNVFFRTQDKAGNIADPVTSSIILDTEPPECSIIINEDAKYANYDLISLELSATDSSSGIYLMAFSFDRELWTQWKPFKNNEKLTLPEGDGLKTVYLRVMDKAGNIGVGTDTIILDTISPDELSIVINNDAMETDSTKVTLSLNAIDETSGIYQMAFSMDSITWSDWEEFSKNATFDLPTGNGEKTIYFRAVDQAGNIGYPSFDTIVLNEPVQPEKTKSEKIDFWLLIIILIIIIIFTILAIMYKRKKRVPEELPLKAAITIKPKELPISPMTLAKISPAPKIPQLPPANVQAQMVQTQPTIATPATTVTHQALTPTNTHTLTPTLKSTSTSVPSPKAGPVVHLPDSTPQPTLATPTQPAPPDQKPAPNTIVTDPVEAVEQQKTVPIKSDENDETSKEVSEDNTNMG